MSSCTLRSAGARCLRPGRSTDLESCRYCLRIRCGPNTARTHHLECGPNVDDPRAHPAQPRADNPGAAARAHPAQPRADNRGPAATARSNSRTTATRGPLSRLRHRPSYRCQRLARPRTWVEFKVPGCSGCQQIWTTTNADGWYSIRLPDGFYLALCGSRTTPAGHVPPSGETVVPTLSRFLPTTRRSTSVSAPDGRRHLGAVVSAGRCYSADGRCRWRLVADRCSFAARRRRLDPRVGLVARRRAAAGARPSATRSESLARAISRLRS